MTIRELLARAAPFLKEKGIESARLDAELLLAHALGWARLDLFLRGDAPVADLERDRYRELARRRAQGEPVAYLIGEKEFYSRLFLVNPAVLIPRPETECLIERAEKVKSPPRRILDLGTGSGCLAVTAALLFPQSELVAVDLSHAALGVARQNADRHGLTGRVQLVEGDMGDPNFLKTLGDFDLVLTNPPYISEAEYPALPREVRNFEPQTALVAAEAGLRFYRVFLAALPGLLSKSGIFLAEIGATQGEAVMAMVREILQDKAWRASIDPDYAGRDRVLGVERADGL